MRSLLFLFALSALLSFPACTGTDDDGTGGGTDNFDRAAMLISWADELILPAYADFIQTGEALQNSAQALLDDPNTTTFARLKADFETAYLSWQSITMFQIGPAEAVGLREQLNAYPTDVAGIEDNISSGAYNFELPSQRSRQGFPALDYLLFGAAAEETAILTRIENEANYREYLLAISERINSLVTNVRAGWLSEYREEFVSQSGNSATASVDRLVNDYVFYYEKFLRAGKIGIPAGIFSGSPLATHVEALYHQELGKELLLAALAATQDFFNGQRTAEQPTSNGMADYLDFLNSVKDGADLSQSINQQFEAARTAIHRLSDDLSQQVLDDNSLMLMAYDELQRNVVLLKLDMLQALNINVDYVDADGD